MSVRLANQRIALGEAGQIVARACPINHQHDDPAGRLIEHFGDRVTIARYPAIAEEDEKYRRAGEPLFPELKSLEFLELRRKTMTHGSWEALYQQSPFVVGGDIFPLEKISIVPERPAVKDVVSTLLGQGRLGWKWCVQCWCVDAANAGWDICSC